VSDPRVARRLGAVAFLVYLASGAGIPSANPGSHFALVRAMAEQRSFVIDAYAAFTHGIDVARVEGRSYSNKSPVLAALALPLYAAGRAWATGFSWPAYPVGHDAGDPAVVFVLLLPALAGAACVALVYRIARRLGATRLASGAAAATAGTGTLLWRYATTLYSHAASAALLAGLVFTALTASGPLRGKRAFAVGLLAGLAAAIEYSNAVAVVLVGFYLVAARGVRIPRTASDAAGLAFLAFGLALPIAGLMVYNAACFGAPFATAYAHATSWDGGRGVVDAARLALPGFSTPLRRGLTDLVLGGEKVAFPLLPTSPALALAPLGWLLLARRSFKEALLLAAAPLAVLLPMATFRAYWGGSVADTRYVVAALPLLAVPLARVFDAGRTWGRALARGLVLALLAPSVARASVAVAVFDGHPIRELRPPRSAWDVRAGLAALFPAASAFFPRTSGDYEATGRFARWEWSEDGQAWSVAPPARSARGRLLQRAFFDANARALPATLQLLGRGCLAAVAVNKVSRHQASCTGATDAAAGEWAPLAIGGLVWPGLNLFEVEVRGDSHIDAAVLRP
jgi:hypothetical protein